MTDTQQKCTLCHKDFFPYPMGEKNGYSFFACKICGSVTTEPAITEDIIAGYYADADAQATHVPNPENAIKIAEGLIRKATGGNFSGKSFLDVYCRQGYAVKAATMLGMQARGLHPRSFYIDFAREKYPNIPFDTTPPESLSEQADVIFCIEALVEQADPEKILSATAKRLKQGGVLYIEEVDGNSYHVPGNFAAWNYVEPPLTNSFISRKALTAMLARNGLKIQKSFWSWSPFMRLLITHK